MPTMANITIKNVALVDVIYTALQPAGGDKMQAVWRDDSVSTVPPNMRPTLVLTSKSSVDGKFRIVEGKYTRPVVYTETNTGLVKLQSTHRGSFTHAIDLSATEASASESARQFANLLASSLIVSSLSTGFSPV